MRRQLRAIWRVFRRGDFCSTKCLKAYNRDEALSLNWNARRVDDRSIVHQSRIKSREIETVEKPLAKIQAMNTLHTSTHEARAVLWTGILGVAKQLGKREGLPTKRHPSVVQLREGPAETPVYFIGVRTLRIPSRAIDMLGAFALWG